MTSPIQTSAEALEADAIPAISEVHVTPEAHCPDVPEELKKAAAKKSPARWAYERIIFYIKKFEETLDNEHELAMGFVGSTSGTLKIEGMGYFDPDIVTFYGTDPTGAKTQMIQHVTQMNVTLRALPKHIDAAEPNRIGFRLFQELEDKQLSENNDISTT